MAELMDSKPYAGIDLGSMVSAFDNTPVDLSFMDGLTENQRLAALSNGPTLVLAGAGTGKTRTLTAAAARRLSDGIHSHRLLSITFTNKAAHEMRDRIKQTVEDEVQLPWVGTFHSICCRLLRKSPDYAGLNEKFDIADGEDSLKIFMSCFEKGAMDKSQAKSHLRAIETFKDWLCPPEEATARVGDIVANMQALNQSFDLDMMYESIPHYQTYQDRLRETNRADFGDLMLWVVHAMEQSEATRERIASRWDAVLVDEYQDVNYAQYRFIHLLGQRHKQVFVVGDDDQSIYGFRNSNVSYIRQFAEEFEDTTKVFLEENFRSFGNILEAANNIISKEPGRFDKVLFTKKENGFPIDVIHADDDMQEASAICKAIETCYRHGIPYGEMAIIYRANSLSRVYESNLGRHKIPYRVIGDLPFFRRQEIKDAVALLRLCASFDDKQSDDAFSRMVNVPKRGFGESKMMQVRNHARNNNISFAAAAERMQFKGGAGSQLQCFLNTLRNCADMDLTLPLQADYLLTKIGYREMLRDKNDDKSMERLSSLGELISLMEEFSSLEEFMEMVALENEALANKQEGDVDRVNLITIHRAKGLEYTVGFLVGWDEGILPSGQSVEAGLIDEERRLAYVALTRCKNYAFIASSRRRVSRKDYGMPSQFIHDIPQKLLRFHKLPYL